MKPFSLTILDPKMTPETIDFDRLPGTDLVARPDQVPAALRDAVARAGDMARAGQASATRRAYRSDFAVFAAWCARHGAAALRRCQRSWRPF